MNTLLFIQKSITFLTLTLTLSIIPKQVMALPGLSHYPTQVNTDVDTCCLNLLLDKSNLSIVSQVGYTPGGGKGKPDEENSTQGGGGR
ncbi:MAG: hypothetical protein AAGJ08_13370 [Cyanobacteria bacterium P01_H01_bin.35]